MQTRYYSLMHAREIKVVPGAQEGLANLMGVSSTINPANQTVNDFQRSMQFNSNFFGFGDGFGDIGGGFLPGAGGGDTTGGTSGGVDPGAIAGAIGGIAGGIAGAGIGNVAPIVGGPFGAQAGPGGGSFDLQSLAGNIMVGLLALLLVGLGIYVLFGKEINEVVIKSVKAGAEVA